MQNWKSFAFLRRLYCAFFDYQEDSRSDSEYLESATYLFNLPSYQIFLRRAIDTETPEPGDEWLEMYDTLTDQWYMDRKSIERNVGALLLKRCENFI